MLNIKSERNSISMIPKNKLLIEIDAPFIQEITFGHDIYKELYQTIKGNPKLREEDLYKAIEENSQQTIR